MDTLKSCNPSLSPALALSLLNVDLLRSVWMLSLSQRRRHRFTLLKSRNRAWRQEQELQLEDEIDELGLALTKATRRADTSEIDRLSTQRARAVASLEEVAPHGCCLHSCTRTRT
eukprot:723626-Pleurochrysis_carterae.AAC.2